AFRERSESIRSQHRLDARHIGIKRNPNNDTALRGGSMRKPSLRNNFDFFSARILISLLPLSLLGLTACNRSDVQAAGPAMPPPLVTVVQAETHDVPRYLDEIGKNNAYESVNVTPQVGGRIVERHFKDGDNLHKGQLLFVIDPRPYK